MRIFFLLMMIYLPSLHSKEVVVSPEFINILENHYQESYLTYSSLEDCYHLEKGNIPFIKVLYYYKGQMDAYNQAIYEISLLEDLN